MIIGKDTIIRLVGGVIKNAKYNWVNIFQNQNL